MSTGPFEFRFTNDFHLKDVDIILVKHPCVEYQFSVIPMRQSSSMTHSLQKIIRANSLLEHACSLGNPAVGS